MSRGKRIIHASNTMVTTIDDCVEKLRSLRHKKTASRPIISPKTTCSKYVLNRLFTLGGVTNYTIFGSKYVTNNEALLVWDNMLCLESPELRECIKQARRKETLNQINSLGIGEITYL